MSCEFGKALHISIFGESHGKAVGVLIDGLPAGERIDMQKLQEFMDRRRPGKNALVTSRREQDNPQFLSGLLEGRTCGSPLCAILPNEDCKPSDYSGIMDIPRPSHADYTAYLKWLGNADLRGGGHLSGRLTAPMCVAGGIAAQILAKRGIYIGSHLKSVGTVVDSSFPLFPEQCSFQQLAKKEIPAIDENAAAEMKAQIEKVSQDGDSIGGVIECAAIGFPTGIGAPHFDGIENRLSSALFGIPAVKGVEFGLGFSGCTLHGSEVNDAFVAANGSIMTKTNHSGGIQGGISNGMPILFRVAVKPTPSITMEQDSVSISRGTNEKLTIHGRHDPCIALRALPVVEAITAAVLLDFMLEEKV